MVITGTGRSLAPGTSVQFFDVPTSNERKALWFFALVALSGSGARLWRSHGEHPTVGETAALDAQLQRVDSVRARDHRTKRLVRGAKAAVSDRTDSVMPVDLDRAAAAEIEALPGIGPALAQRIVAWRDSAGGFGEIDALCDVPGVGPGLAKKVRPLVTFTAPRRPLVDACSEPKKRARGARVTGAPQPR